MKIPLILMLSIAISGCASAFKPSEQFLSLKGKITRPEAVTTLQRISRGNAAKGEPVICRLGTLYGADQNTQLEFTASEFSYQAYTKGEYVGEKAGTQYYKKAYFQKKTPFRDISMVRILPYNGSDCQAVKGGQYDHIVVLQKNPITEALAIAVNKSDLDAYLAAIISLTQSPRIVQGVGF